METNAVWRPDQRNERPKESPVESPVVKAVEKKRMAINPSQALLWTAVGSLSTVLVYGIYQKLTRVAPKRLLN